MILLKPNQNLKLFFRNRLCIIHMQPLDAAVNFRTEFTHGLNPAKQLDILNYT